MNSLKYLSLRDCSLGSATIIDILSHSSMANCHLDILDISGMIMCYCALLCIRCVVCSNMCV